MEQHAAKQEIIYRAYGFGKKQDEWAAAVAHLVPQIEPLYGRPLEIRTGLPELCQVILRDAFPEVEVIPDARLAARIYFGYHDHD